jgi:fucose permease
MSSDYRLALCLLCATFVADGLTIAAIGPMLPELAARTDRTLAGMGTLFIAQFGGALLSTMLGGWVSDRFGRRVVLVSASALFSVAAVAVTFSPRLLVMLICMTILGLGYGGVGIAVNVLASELNPQRRAATLNFVNLFYAAGAIAGPLLAGRMLVWFGTARPAMWIGAALMLLLVPLAMRVTLPASAIARRSSSSRAADGTRANQIDRATQADHADHIDHADHADDRVPAHFIWTSGLLLFLYVGSEAATGAWTPAYLAASTGVDAARAATLTSLFWGSLCIGRLFGTVGGLHLAAERLLSLSLALATAGAIVLAVGHGHVWSTVIALLLIGLAFGPVYPTTVAIVTARFPHAAGAAMSTLASVGQAGGMALPALQGWMLARVGTLSSALFTLGITVAMATLWMAIGRDGRASRPRV